MRARDQVGELRPSQLMHTYGVGATVELPELTTLVLGLDDWPQALCETVSEPRLLAAVRATRGPQVERLRTPPTVPEGESGGVPVAPFPRWLRCPLCSLLAPIDNGLFEFRPDRWRPERTTYVHTGCPKSHTRRPPTAYPARYLMACEAGNLDDFPWVQFLHGGLPCPGTLRLRELGSGGRATDIQLSCDQCRRSRRLSQAFGEDARPFLPPRCRGRHPHLGITQRECSKEPLTLLLGASNAWFPVGMSALSIPSREGVVAQAVEEAWGHLEGLPAPSFLEYALREVPGLARLRALAETEGADAVREAVCQRRSGTADEDPADLRGPEWRVLCDPDNAPASADFQLRPVPAPRDLAGALADVVLVERLREVSALTGFTRISAPDDAADAAAALAPLSRAEPRWLPCSEVRGEGIFLRLPETRVQEWEQAYRASGSARELSDAHRSWRVRRSLDPDQGWPGERYVLLHSLAHALIRELALECGYTASSIRERIYADASMAGVLLYTAAPDSEGTLGGLVSLGEPDELGPLLRNALERAQLCSSDPLCAEHDPRSDGSVHAAACHACQFASETSCERGNRFLDRGALIATLAGAGHPYFLSG
ncbi:MAG: DrmB family protein [Solirubrobacteraceae bacterium]